MGVRPFAVSHIRVPLIRSCGRWLHRLSLFLLLPLRGTTVHATYTTAQDTIHHPFGSAGQLLLHVGFPFPVVRNPYASPSSSVLPPTTTGQWPRTCQPRIHCGRAKTSIDASPHLQHKCAASEIEVLGIDGLSACSSLICGPWVKRCGKSPLDATCYMPSTFLSLTNGPRTPNFNSGLKRCGGVDLLAS